MQLKHRMKRNRKATHIQWDVDELEDLELLPVAEAFFAERDGVELVYAI